MVAVKNQRLPCFLLQDPFIYCSHPRIDQNLRAWADTMFEFTCGGPVACTKDNVTSSSGHGIIAGLEKFSGHSIQHNVKALPAHAVQSSLQLAGILPAVPHNDVRRFQGWKPIQQELHLQQARQNNRLCQSLHRGECSWPVCWPTPHQA